MRRPGSKPNNTEQKMLVLMLRAVACRVVP